MTSHPPPEHGPEGDDRTPVTPDPSSEATDGAKTAKTAGKEKLISDSALTAITEATAAALTLLAGILIARTLGPAGRGIYAVLILVPLTLQQAGLLGLPIGIVHFAIRDPEGIGHRGANTLVAAVILGIPLAALAWMVLSSGFVAEFEHATVQMKILLVMGLPLLLFQSFAQGVVLGLDDLVKRNALKLTEVIPYFTMVAVVVVGLKWGLAGAVACWTIGTICPAILAGIYMYPIARKARFRPDLARLKTDALFGIKAYVAFVAFFLLHRCDQYLVAYFMSSEYVGFYSVAAALSMVMQVLPHTVEQAFLPKVTSRYVEGGGREDMTPVMCRLSMIVSLLIAIPFMLAAYPIVWLFYGEAFLPAARCLMIIIPAGTIVSALWVLLAAMQARGAHGWTSVAAFIGFVVNVILDLALIPAYGIDGAALGTAIAYLVFVGVVVWRFLCIDTHLTWRDLMLPRGKDVKMLYWAVEALFQKVLKRA